MTKKTRKNSASRRARPGFDPVVVIGSGNVGSALARGLRSADRRVRLLRFRNALPRSLSAKLVVLCVRDDALPDLVWSLSQGERLERDAAVVHVAGALAPDVLAPLRSFCAGIGQAHPLLSFASRKYGPALVKGHMLVAGDAVAVRRASALARALGMVPRAWRGVDAFTYHAAAGLVANGTAALAGAGLRLLERAGCPERDLSRALGPLLRSVADNVERLGLPHALTGPIRRGDVVTVERHLKAITRQAPELLDLYLACAEAQLPIAARLGDASANALATVRRRLGVARQSS